MILQAITCYRGSRASAFPAVSIIVHRIFSMTDDIEQTARDTVDLLEQRLRRIEYFLTGHDPAQESLQEAVAEGKDRTVLTRLAKVENSLAKLASSSPVVEDLLKLCKAYASLMYFD